MSNNPFPHQSSGINVLSKLSITPLLDYKPDDFRVCDIDIGAFGHLMLMVCACVIPGFAITIPPESKFDPFNFVVVMSAFYFIANVVLPYPIVRVSDLIIHIQRRERDEGYPVSPSLTLYWYYVLWRRYPHNGFTRFIIIQLLTNLIPLVLAWWTSNTIIYFIAMWLSSYSLMVTMLWKLESESISNDFPCTQISENE